MNKIETEVQRILDVLGVSLRTNPHKVWDAKDREFEACTVGISTVIRAGMIPVNHSILGKSEAPGFIVEQWSLCHNHEEGVPTELLGEFRSLGPAVAVAVGAATMNKVEEIYEEEQLAEEDDRRCYDY